jgi:CPA2 family monovalent cation:H+ antiporter-2/glutathione-regulated potassium-efflux system ancillary protein KefC
MDLGVTTIRREIFVSALILGQDALQLLGFDPYEAYTIRRLFRKKDQDTMPDLYRIHRQDEDKYFSMYQQHKTNLVGLMTKDSEIDMAELDKAWTAANPETWKSVFQVKTTTHRQDQSLAGFWSGWPYILSGRYCPKRRQL